MLKIGTCHFIGKSHAYRYYSRQGETIETVNEKIAAGEIFIGAPAIVEGQSLEIVPSEGRYVIVDER